MSFACSASSATLLAATAQALTLLSRIIKPNVLEAAHAKHAYLLELLVTDSAESAVSSSVGFHAAGTMAIHDLFVKLLQADEQGGMSICYTYRSCLLLPTALTKDTIQELYQRKKTRYDR